MKKQNFFLTLEGTHGVGKSTIAAKLIKKLSGKGYKTVYLQAQSGTPVGKELRKINLGFEDLSPLAEALIVGAARHQCVKDVIKPNLQKGKFVICERFSDAFMAYGFARGLKTDFMETLNEAIIDGVNPDLTLLIDSNPKKALERTPIGERHRFEKENLEFHSCLRSGYLQLGKKYSERIKVIDGNGSPDSVFSHVWEIVKDAILQ